MKIEEYNYANRGNFAFCFMLALGRAVDKGDEWIELYYKGNQVCIIQPTTKDWWDLKDILQEYRWENYPEGYSDCLCMNIGDIWVKFDEFRERGL